MNLRTTLMAAPTAVSLVLLASLVAVLMAMNRYESRVSATHEQAGARQDTISTARQRLSEAHAGLYRTITVIGSLAAHAHRAFNAATDAATELTGLLRYRAAWRSSRRLGA